MVRGVNDGATGVNEGRRGGGVARIESAQQDSQKEMCHREEDG